MSRKSKEPKEHWVEPEEAEQGILLRLPASADEATLQQLQAALATGRVQGLVALPSLPGPVLAAAASAAKEARIAFLIADDAVAAIDHGADGVLLGHAARLEVTRRILGAERPIGVACGLSRHAAMVAGDDGADYIIVGALDGTDGLGPTATFVGWWAEISVLPCAAVCSSPEAAAELVAAGADMLIPAGSIWSDPAGIDAALEPYLRALPPRAR